MPQVGYKPGRSKGIDMARGIGKTVQASMCYFPLIDVKMILVVGRRMTRSPVVMPSVGECPRHDEVPSSGYLVTAGPVH